jgi:hypothetical protein
MESLRVLPLVTGAIMMAATITASAQGNANSGTAPEGMGSTGWTGGNRGQTGTGNPEAAKDQPFMATGVDLKGPPRQFPAGQTPE